MSGRPKVYAIDGMVPVVDPSTYVHPSAVLIGDVIVGPGCYIGPGAAMRGDFGRLVMERGSNLQDNCVVHGFPGTDTVLEECGDQLKELGKQIDAGKYKKAAKTLGKILDKMVSGKFAKKLAEKVGKEAAGKILRKIGAKCIPVIGWGLLIADAIWTIIEQWLE